MEQRAGMRRYVLLASFLLFAGCVAGCAPSTESGAAVSALPISAQALVGSTPDFLNAEFGQPVLRRVDGTSQVWLYHSSTCGLNLILFPDSAGTPRVAEAVPDNNNALSCTASLEHGHAITAALEHQAAS